MTDAHTPPAERIDEGGPRTRRVLAYDRTLRRVVDGAGDRVDWAPLAEFVAVEEFERTGTFLEVQGWSQYTAMLTGWALATDSFESTVRRISEIGDLVYYEIEERHVRGGDVHVVNSMTVFQFDAQDLICGLSVYLQQAPERLVTE